ncbi:MAG TPA: multidrug effflux MFS transporter [Stellaceae bacterium]|jgi:DHA1 family bicyclomycin/chloramphenicol resistance-like MFS transporter
MRPPPLALLATVTAIGFAALHMVVPVLPLLATVFGRGATEAQLVLTLYFIGIATGQLAYGPLSDRFGRRPVLLCGLGLFLGGTVLCAVAWSLPVLICARVIQALGGCSGLVLSRAIIRDVYDRDASALAIALVMMAMTLVPALCPAVGAYVTEWFGWRAIFVLLGLLGGTALVLSAVLLRETHSEAIPLDLGGLTVSHLTLARSSAFCFFALSSACSSASWFVFIASAPYLLQVGFHQGPGTYGAMILVPMAAYMVGNGAAARLGRRFHSRSLFVAGLLVSVGSGILMALWCAAAPNPWALFIPMALSSIGNGLSQPGALASGLSVFPRIAGTASGVMGFSQMAVSALGTLALAPFPRDSVAAVVGVVFAAQLLALASGVAALRRPGGSLQVVAETGGDC